MWVARRERWTFAVDGDGAFFSLFPSWVERRAQRFADVPLAGGSGGSGKRVEVTDGSVAAVAPLPPPCVRLRYGWERGLYRPEQLSPCPHPPGSVWISVRERAAAGALAAPSHHMRCQAPHRLGDTPPRRSRAHPRPSPDALPLPAWSPSGPLLTLVDSSPGAFVSASTQHFRLSPHSIPLQPLHPTQPLVVHLPVGVPARPSALSSVRRSRASAL